MPSFAVFVLVWFLAATSCFAQLPPVDQAVILKERGLPGLPLVTQALVKGEAGGDLSAAAQQRVADQVGRYVVAADAFKKSPTAGATTGGYASAAVTLLNALGKETRSYELERQHLARQELGNDQFGITATGAIGLLAAPETGGASVALATAASAIGTWALNVNIEQKTLALDATYTQRLNDVVAVAVRNARKDLAVYTPIADAAKSGDPAEAQKALDTLLGSPYFDENFLKQLNPQERQAVEGQMGTVLGDALLRAQTWNESQFEVMRKRVAQNSAALAAVSKVVAQFQQETGAKLAKLAAAQQRTVDAVRDLKTNLQQVVTKTADNSADIETMQRLMWGKLSPPEQLYALDHGFMKGLNDKDRAALRASLKNVASATEFRDKTVAVLQSADGIAHALGALKIVSPGDMQNLVANIGYANAGVNVLVDLVSGNYFGAAAAFGGLFPAGGGAGAAEQAHFEAIMGKLDAILKGEQTILDALQNLSIQLEQSTNVVMNKLADIQALVDIANQQLNDLALGRGKSACLNFQNDAIPYGLRAEGTFPSYALRVAHYNAELQGAGNNFANCMAFLTDTYQLTSTATVPPSNSTPPAALRVQSLNVNNVHFYPQTHYAPMLGLTYFALLNAQPSDKPNCAQRLLVALTAAPAKFSDVDFDQATCKGDADLQDESVAYRDWRHERVDVDSVLSIPMYFPSVQFVGDLLAFYAPYFDLMTRNKGGDALYTQAQLAAGQYTRRTGPAQGEVWFRAYLDVVNMQVAQEALYAGPYLAEAAAAELKKTAFGEDTKGEQADDPFAAWRQKWQSLEALDATQAETEAQVKHLRATWDAAADGGQVFDRNSAESAYCGASAPDPGVLYQVLTCVMARSEPFQQNVVLYLVLKALQQTHMTQAAYTVAYYGPQILMSQVLPNLPVVYRGEGKDSGWYLQLRHHTGERWWLPLPAPYEVADGFVHYSPFMQKALEYRNTVSARLAFYQLHEQQQIAHTAEGQRALQRIALYGKDFMLTEVYAPTAPTLRAAQATSAAKH